MKRTDITDIWPEATKEQIDKIMSLNGADINSAKGEMDALKGQLTSAQTEIEKLKAGGGQPDKLKEAADAIASLQAELNGMKQAETIRTMREKVSKEKNIPADLLTGESEEACAAQADSILAFAKNTGYPVVRDGGEPGGTPAPKTREKFAEWAKDNL